MQISSICEVIGGELLNSPVVSFVYSVKTNLKKVLEGDLFFAKNSNEIEEAVKNGAFAIVTSKDVQISDDEIAWIRVDSIQKAIVRYCRYKLSKYELNTYYCDFIRFELFRNLPIVRENIWYFSSNLDRILLSLNDIKDGDTIFCSCKDTIFSIYPDTNEFKNKKYTVSNFVEHSLSETTFSYKKEYFPKLKLPSLYINEFLDCFTFFKSKIDTAKLKKVDIFRPLFIDNFFNICENGKSGRFLIIQERCELAKNELKYLNSKYSYAKRVFIAKKGIETPSKDFIIVDSLEDIYNKIKELEFNALYILGFNSKKVEELFLKKKEHRLF